MNGTQSGPHQKIRRSQLGMGSRRIFKENPRCGIGFLVKDVSLVNDLERQPRVLDRRSLINNCRSSRNNKKKRRFVDQKRKWVFEIIECLAEILLEAPVP